MERVTQKQDKSFPPAHLGQLPLHKAHTTTPLFSRRIHKLHDLLHAWPIHHPINPSLHTRIRIENRRAGAGQQVVSHGAMAEVRQADEISGQVFEPGQTLLVDSEGRLKLLQVLLDDFVVSRPAHEHGHDEALEGDRRHGPVEVVGLCFEPRVSARLLSPKRMRSPSWKAGTWPKGCKANTELTAEQLDILSMAS